MAELSRTVSEDGRNIFVKVIISALYLYPIKSCAGILTEYLEIRPEGPAVRLGPDKWLGDRQFMFVGEDGVFKSQRTHPKMSQLLPVVEGEKLFLDVVGKKYEVPVPMERDHRSTAAPAAAHSEERQELQLFGKFLQAPVLQNELTEAVSLYLGESVRLAYDNGSLQREAQLKNQGLGVYTRFTDSQQFLVISDESLEDLNKKLKTPIQRDRFRANIWLQGSFPYREDQIQSLATESYQLQSTKGCARCKIITVNPALGQIDDSEPLTALAQYRRRDNQVYFGQYFLSQSLQQFIRAGDSLEASLRSGDSPS